MPKIDVITCEICKQDVTKRKSLAIDNNGKRACNHHEEAINFRNINRNMQRQRFSVKTQSK